MRHARVLVVMAIVTIVIVTKRPRMPAAELPPVGRSAEPQEVGTWLGADSYPPEALRKGEQGRLVAVVSIDAAGRPTSCRIDEPTHSAALDDGTCPIIMTRGRFSPAVDARGRRIASDARVPIRWMIPDTGVAIGGGAQDQGPLDLVQITDIDRDGAIAACDTRINGRVHDGPADQCRAAVPLANVLRASLHLTGTIRVRMVHQVRHGGTVPAVPSPEEDGRLVLSTVERKRVDATGRPYDCTASITPDPTLEMLRPRAPAACLPTTFYPARGLDGAFEPQQLLIVTRFYLLPSAN